MTYNKPNNVTYTQMAIYFDENIYNEPSKRDDSKLYQYLYHIIYMLACKAKYFHKFEDYDEFSLFMATKLYLRYINDKHTQEYGKIKSVLNYCKALLYPMKVDYQKETFAEIIGYDPVSGGNDTMLYESNLRASINQSYCDERGLTDAIKYQIKQTPKYIREVLNNTFYKHDKIMYKRLYMSILLSFIKSITFSAQSIDKLEKRENRGLSNDIVLLQLYEKERDSCVTLWRLSPIYYNLVYVLTTKVRKKCAEELGSTRAELELNEEDLNAVIMSAYGNTLRDNNEEF